MTNVPEVVNYKDFLKVDLVDLAPRLVDFEKIVNPSELVYAGSKITFSSKYSSPLDVIKKKIISSNLEEIRKFVFDVVSRGYASLATTPVAYFSIQGSRLLDFFLTAVPFTSAMVLSQRYVPPKYIIVDDNSDIESMLNAYSLYQEFSNKFPLEIARRILPLGTNSTMLYAIPINVLASLYKYTKLYSEFVPDEIKLAIKKMVQLVEEKDPTIIDASLVSPEFNINIRGRVLFKPKEELAFDDEKTILRYIDDKQVARVLEAYSREFGYMLNNYENLSLQEKINYSWKLADTVLPHSRALEVNVNWLCSLACYNELKRHRTIPLLVEDIYTAIGETLLNNRPLFVPSAVQSREEYKKRYLATSHQLLNSYRDTKSIYSIPHNILIKASFDLDLAQLLAPNLFYGIRSCITAEFEIREKVWKLPELVKEALETKGYEELAIRLYSLLKKNGLPISKCKVGFCPEPKGRSCKLINNLFPRYDHDKTEIEREKLKEEFTHL